ncbi:MAG: DUF2064 domain-containing protein [Halopseudomonas sp.]
MSDSVVEPSLYPSQVNPAAAQSTLVLLFKRPLAGQGKQRLAASFGREPTRRLAETFLHCAIEDLTAWPGRVVLAPAQASDRLWAKQLLNRADVVPQGEGNLGQRIIDLDRQLRSLGHQQLVYIGSDAPALTPSHYRSVANHLTQTDVVLSAADDGGVTIMASREPWPERLIELPWSTEQLGEALASCCQQQGLGVSYMEPSYDIDFEQDLARLVDDLADDTRPARQQLSMLLKALMPADCYANRASN